MIGTTLSHYRIIDELGRGGMGIVYKAEDTKLDRTVAIKVLPASALTSEDDRARFYREAKSAAALNHPHIAQIYQIDEAIPEGGSVEEPRPFIAMEYIDGMSLDAHVSERPLPLDEAVRLTTQIAQALEVAHEKNIVHRDIKAANVMLTAKGDAKVLDFGLAKTAQSTMLTRMGSTLGTVAYMSPEQARGEDVDGRTDLWALGILLYQLVAGRLPFGGDYEQAVTYSILNEDPQPLTAVRTGVPMGLEWIVSKLLAKKADDRYQHAKDLIVDLRTVDLTKEGLSRTTTLKSMPAAPAAQTIKRNPLDLTGRLHPAAIVLFIAMGAVAGWWFSRPPEALPGTPQIFEISLDEIRNPVYVEPSQDGRLLVIMGQDSTLTSFYTYIYDTVERELRVLNQNTGDRYFFSPDQTELAYRQGINIYKVSVLGGTPIEVGRYGSGWPEWTLDGDLIFDWNESLWLHPADGSDPYQVSQVDSLNGEGGHYNATMLPDGKHAIIHITRTTGEVRQLAILNLSTSEHRVIGNGASATFLDSGHILYVDGSLSASGQMLLRPFDVDRLEWAGPPAILEEAGNVGEWGFDGYNTAYFLDRPENVAPLAGQRFRFVEVDPESRGEAPFAAPENTRQFAVSPDGRSIIAGIDTNGDLMLDYTTLVDRGSDISQRVPFPSPPVDVRWTPDGNALYVGTGNEIQKWSMTSLQVEKSWGATGFPSTFDITTDESKVYYINHPNADWGRIRELDLETGEDRILAEGQFFTPRLSPDGRYLIAADMRLNLQVISTETGAIRPLSTAGEPAFGWEWASNGYIYLNVNGDLRRVNVTTEPTFRIVGQTETFGTFVGLGGFSVDEAGRVIGLIDNSLVGEESIDVPAKITVYTEWDQRAHSIAPWQKN